MNVWWWCCYSNRVNNDSTICHDSTFFLNMTWIYDLNRYEYRCSISVNILKLWIWLEYRCCSISEFFEYVNHVDAWMFEYVDAWIIWMFHIWIFLNHVNMFWIFLNIRICFEYIWICFEYIWICFEYIWIYLNMFWILLNAWIWLNTWSWHGMIWITPYTPPHLSIDPIVDP